MIDDNFDSGFRRFMNECLHLEAFDGRIPRAPRQQQSLGDQIFGRNQESDVPEFTSADLEAGNKFNSLDADEYAFQMGVGLIYDSVHDVLDVFDEHKYDFYENRYVMLGAAFDANKKQIKCLSPYFIKVGFNPQEFKKADGFVTKLKASVKEFINPILQRTGKDVKAEIMKESDIEKINNFLPEISESLNNLCSYIQFNDNINKILINETTVLNDGSFFMNSFGPEYFAAKDIDYTEQLAAQSEYKQLSDEEFYNRAMGIVSADDEDIKEEMHPIEAKTEERAPVFITYSFKDFKKAFKKAEWFECYIPVVLKINLG